MRFHPNYLALLAQIYRKAGRAEEGLAWIDEALSEARIHGERWWDAELHRLRSEQLLMHGAEASDVEAALLRAISIAQSQQARSLELRATMSLARFWSIDHRSDDARHRLEDVYNWFTEGFETPGVPIWIGSWGSEAGLRRVVRLGEGWCHLNPLALFD